MRVPKTERELISTLKEIEHYDDKWDLDSPSTTLANGSQASDDLSWVIVTFCYYFYDDIFDGVNLGKWTSFNYSDIDGNACDNMQQFIGFEHPLNNEFDFTTQFEYFMDCKRGIFEFAVPEWWKDDGVNVSNIPSVRERISTPSRDLTVADYMIEVMNEVASFKDSIVNIVRAALPEFEKVLKGLAKSQNKEKLNRLLDKLEDLYTQYKAAASEYIELGGDEEDIEDIIHDINQIL